MLTKAIIVIVFFGVLASLGSALYFMVKDKGGGSERTARALSVRIGVSVGLFVMLFVLYGLGVIEPHGGRP